MHASFLIWHSKLRRTTFCSKQTVQGCIHMKPDPVLSSSLIFNLFVFDVLYPFFLSWWKPSSTLNYPLIYEKRGMSDQDCRDGSNSLLCHWYILSQFLWITSELIHLCHPMDQLCISYIIIIIIDINCKGLYCHFASGRGCYICYKQSMSYLKCLVSEYAATLLSLFQMSQSIFIFIDHLILTRRWNFHTKIN